MLQDDPNFLPDSDLMPVDLERLDFDLTVTEDHARSSIVPPHESQLADFSTQSQHDLGYLVIPGSISSSMRGPANGFRHLNIDGDSRDGTRRGTRGVLDDDLGLDIDQDGNLLMGNDQDSDPPAPRLLIEQARAGSIGSRARSENEEAQRASVDLMVMFCLQLLHRMLTDISPAIRMMKVSSHSKMMFTCLEQKKSRSFCQRRHQRLIMSLRRI